MIACATCKWFKPVEAGRFMEGGWCDWRPPIKLRGLLWGAHNERIVDPTKEWCAEHVDNGQSTKGIS